MHSNFENKEWKLEILGDHAIVFSLQPLMDESIMQKIIALKKTIEEFDFDFIKELIPSYHTLTLVYDINLFYAHSIGIENKKSINEFGYSMLKVLNPVSEKLNENEIIRIPVCYDKRFGIDLENISKRNKISAEKIIEKHSEEIYRVYCLGFLPGFAYMGKVKEQIQIARHPRPRQEVLAGSVGIAGLQTGIYPMNSPGGWQIIGRTPFKIFDPNPNILTKIKVGNRIQFYPITLMEFENLNEYK